jgi:hypothetical protein
MFAQYLNFDASRINCQFGIILYKNSFKMQVTYIKLSILNAYNITNFQRILERKR